MSRNLVFSSLVLFSALLAWKASTGSDAKINVSCEGTEDAINCDVSHREGESAANACWLKFGCANGQTVTGSPSART